VRRRGHPHSRARSPSVLGSAPHGSGGSLAHRPAPSPAKPVLRYACRAPAPLRPAAPGWFQTGAVKQGRNTDSQAASAGGTRCGSAAVAARRRFDAIPVVESTRTYAARVPALPAATQARDSASLPVMDDPVIQRIESFRCRRGALLAERRSRGYTLYHAKPRPV
jgi:hypothetical protein